MAAELSVVMVTKDRFDRLLASLRHLAADPDTGRVELVVVVGSEAEAAVDAAELAAFGSYRIVEHGPVVATGAAMSTGMRAATAPVVAYLEDHVFVGPGWVDAILRAHEGHWGSVGQTLDNANPGLASWAALLVDFGGVTRPVHGGPGRPLGWHQASYKRALLDARSDRLAGLLETEGLLHAELAAEGHPTFLADRVRVEHANVERALALLRSSLIGGRLFAARRVEHEGMSIVARLIRAAAAPIVPMMRMRTLRADAARVGSARPIPRLAVGLGAVALVAHATGEALGFLLGAGDSVRDKVALELDRAAFVDPGVMDPAPRPIRVPSPPRPGPPRSPA